MLANLTTEAVSALNILVGVFNNKLNVFIATGLLRLSNFSRRFFESLFCPRNLLFNITFQIYWHKIIPNVLLSS